jgi:hypothetical protein
MSNVEERYSRAINSSHLEVTEFAGDIDSLVAAGWVRDSLATTLYRLRVEFDACDMRSIRPFAPTPAPETFYEEAQGPRLPDGPRLYVEVTNEVVIERKRRAWNTAEKARVAKDFADRRVIAKALALVHMQSLPAARDALGRFVMAQATRMDLDTNPEEQLRLSGRILDYLLDPMCEICSGVKFKEIAGTGRLSNMACAGCDGSGKRPWRCVGANARDSRPTRCMCKPCVLSRNILGDLDRKMENVRQLMQRFTRAVIHAKKIPLPEGARMARPRIADGQVYYEFSRDGAKWFRAASKETVP